ncbi:MAG: 2-oxo acid dehydrogenase subunit E2 [Polyangiaceae bacterium]
MSTVGRTRLRGWRRIADAMWTAPNDPQIYGSLELDATPVLAFINRERAAGRKVTVTHAVGRALALGIRQVPDLNVRLLGGFALPRDSVDIFFITSVAAGKDLSGVKIRSADEKTAGAIADELERRARAQKNGQDADLAKSKNVMEALPKHLLRAALHLSAFIAGDLDKGIDALALRSSPFGSAMVTSVGMFGLPMGFAPLAWMYKVPILVLVGEVTEKPVAVQGRVEIRPILPICATIDHRWVDGWHISKLMGSFKAYLADPSAFEGL